jgi:hypothetical protein
LNTKEANIVHFVLPTNVVITSLLTLMWSHILLATILTLCDWSMRCPYNGTRSSHRLGIRMYFNHRFCMTRLRCRYVRNATSVSKVDTPYITCSRYRCIVIVLNEYVFFSCNIVFMLNQQEQLLVYLVDNNM